MAAIDLLASYAEIFGFVLVLIALAFALVQVRQARRHRVDLTTIEAFHAWQTPEVIAAHTLVASLPPGGSARDLRARGPDMEKAANLFGHVTETLGVMVFRRVASLAAVQDMMGGAIVHDWERLRNYVDAIRAEQERPNAYEWFQWLAERLVEHRPKYKDVGAHLALRRWRP